MKTLAFAAAFALVAAQAHARVEAQVQARVEAQVQAQTVRPSSSQTAQARADLAILRACLDAPGAAGPERCGDRISAPCLERPADQTTSGMTACGAREDAAWDVILNEAYRATLAALEPAAAARLRAAQRLWIRSRDADMAVHAEQDGTIRRVIAAARRAELTRDRALWLRGFALN